MKIKTLIALVGSIIKWDKIAKGKGEDLGWTNCPLCMLFPNTDCRGCPVAEDTGNDLCVGTPYYDARSALLAQNPSSRTAVSLGAKAAAEDERDYLVTLLPDADDIEWE